MNKTAQLLEYRNKAVDWAFESFYKMAQDPKVELTTEDVEKVAEDRAKTAVGEAVNLAEVETFVNTVNEVIEVLHEGEFKEAAELISKKAMEGLGNTTLPSNLLAPAPVAEAGVEAGTEAAPEEGEASDDEIAEAAVQGAAEVVAEIVGKEPTDPEVLEAAEEIVQEAVAAAEEVATGTAAEAGGVTGDEAGVTGDEGTV